MILERKKSAGSFSKGLNHIHNRRSLGPTGPGPESRPCCSVQELINTREGALAGQAAPS
jgi:hypothetical protein